MIIGNRILNCLMLNIPCVMHIIYANSKRLWKLRKNDGRFRWQEDWPYLRYIIRVTRHRHLYKTQKEASKTVSHYVSNAALSAQEYGQYIREHWFIEN